MIRLDASRATDMLDDGALDDLTPRLADAHRAILDKSGAGSDFLGWRDLLTEIGRAHV